MTTAKTIANAIRESIQTNRRVDITLTEADFDDLIYDAEGSARENDGTHDVWGTDANGNEWRLCVTIED